MHADTLTRLAGEAAAFEAAGRTADAVIAWRSALDLLPHDAPQAAAIRARVDTLTRDGAAVSVPASPMPKWLASLGLVGALLWKFKFVVALVLTKGKLLLTGLTQSGTLLVMVILGGAGSLTGGVLGAAALLLLQEGLASVSEHGEFWTGWVLLAVVLFARNGLAALLRPVSHR